MVRVRLFIICVLPIALGLAGCYADQKKQLQACESSASRSGPGEPLKSIQACMDTAGYAFVGYANPNGETVVCDLPAVIQGRFTNTAALCFQPKGWLALRIYRWEVPDRGVQQAAPEQQ
ncbi:MAG TPA: hypothetical protein VG798_04430 [Rhizomicrobium sp.]|nr:hypothetical protein [Rhizomicrobium sp.]